MPGPPADPPSKPPRRIDLFAPAALDRAVAAAEPPVPPTEKPGDGQVLRVPGASRGHELALLSPFDFRPLPEGGPELEARLFEHRRLLLGRTYEALAMPPPLWSPSLREQLDGIGALSLIPGALLGSLARPLVDEGSRLLERLPGELRRPLQRAFGQLLDGALAVASGGSLGFAGVALDQAMGDGRPKRVALRVPGYGQAEMSCGETAAAAVLKAAGQPVSLGEPDTQLPGFDGSSLAEEGFVRRRGLSYLNGPTSFDHLRGLLAAGLPVMTLFGTKWGGAHYAVVSGYDDERGELTIENYFSDGVARRVKYDEFRKYWSQRANYASVVLPRKDPRLDGLARLGQLSRETPPDEGVTVSDFFVSPRGEVFVEGAYRYLSPDGRTDVTVRVSFDSAQKGIERQLGGGLAFKQYLARGYWLGLRIEKLSLFGKPREWQSLGTTPLAVYGSIVGPGFEFRVGGERGGFQASLLADLGRFVEGLGIAANVSLGPDGSYAVAVGVSGTA